MRIYTDAIEAHREIKREFREMAIEVANTSYEDKYFNDDRYFTLEMLNYGYTILRPELKDITINTTFLHLEWLDWLSGAFGSPLNPGTAYMDCPGKDRFLEVGGRPTDGETNAEDLAEQTKSLAVFSYTHSERLAIRQQVFHIIGELRRNQTSRQLYISIWDPNQDAERIGSRRVPGTLGYHLIERSGQVHLTHLMRSCEFSTHFSHDVWLATKLLHFICDQAGKTPGRLAHFINSFHIYKANTPAVL